MIHLAVDIMGGDQSPIDLFQGVVNVAQELKGLARFTVLADKTHLDLCQQKPTLDLDIDFLEASEEVLMDDSPLYVVRRKHNSSMAKGIKMLKNQACDGFVSVGNTGAMTAFATLELDKLPGIERPALLATLPSEQGKVAILDVGANVTFRPEHLMQFALMGAAYQRVTQNKKQPKIGLLNIGGEARKGTRIVRQAYDYFNLYAERLEDKNICFEGNVEARDVFEGKVDVLVTDGFTGNVFLKTCEGVSSFIVDQVASRFSKYKSPYPKVSFKEIEKYLDYAEYPGAVLLGVDGVIVKCHGCSSSIAFQNGIKGAYYLAKNQIIGTIRAQLNDFQRDLSEQAIS